MPKFTGLTLKLTLAFVAVAVAGIVIVGLLVKRATAAQFSSYLEQIARMRGMSRMWGKGGMGWLGGAEQNFLQRIDESLWLAGAIAVAAAVLLSLLLSRQIVAPLRRLTLAAERIARGDFSHRVSISSRDELGELAQAFNAMAKTLAENEEVRRNLVADTSHELRTPLAVLQGKIEAMLDGVIMPTPDNLASLHGEVLLLSRLVADLHTLTLAEAGRLKLNLVPTNLEEVARRVVDSFRLPAEEKGIVLSLHIPPDLPRALVDAERFSQILSNLLSNALRYTQERGTIKVEVGESAGGKDQRSLLLSVSDTGIGTEDLPHIFDRFYRADPSRTRATGGSGIGLAIVKELVGAHGGRVWVESKQGQGSTFYFTLPLAK